MSLLLQRLLPPLALVWTRSKLLVLLSRRVNSVKLRRLALEADCRFSVEVRGTVGGDAGARRNSPSSESWMGMDMLLSRGVEEDASMVDRWG